MAKHLRLEHFWLETDGDEVPGSFAGDDEFGAPPGRFPRAVLLTGAGVLLGAVAGAGTLGPATAAPSPPQDRRILRFLLQLEHLQADFYAAALDGGRLEGELREFAEVVGAHEREHIAVLEERLGRATGRKATFDFGEATTSANRFARATRRLEETGVAACIGQGANLTPHSVLAVSRIAAVEARHAAWIADLLGRNPAPRAADKAKTGKQVRTVIRRTRFLR